jgi:crotonobetainyl-CoA:carnitine CoA-transferase CaiB-like acyl-CoA transferase
MKGALSNIRVLDLTRVLAGPFCTMMLADMGADVIKIEMPGKGDDTREFGPFKNGQSMYFANVNRNKRGITLNLKSKQGKEIFLEMVKKADMVVENYRPGVMARLGLNYEELHKINDQIIYGAVSGLGQYGPYMQRPGYDIVAQAMGGLMSITGWDERPTRVGNAMGDILGGLSLAIGLLAALNARKLTGRGQMVDVSLVDSVVASLETGTQRFFATGENPPKTGNRYQTAYPYDSFKAKDGDFIIGCAGQKIFEDFCNKVLIMPELITDKRFETNEKRTINHVSMKEIIENWAKDYTISEVVKIILDAGVPAAEIYDLHRITTDEHIADVREMFPTIHHPVIGDMKVNGCHIKLSDTKPEMRTPSPSLGQHNEEIYKDFLGISKEELMKLEEKKVI